MTIVLTAVDRVGIFISQRINSKIEVVNESITRNPQQAVLHEIQLVAIKRDQDRLGSLIRAAASPSPANVGAGYTPLDTRKMALAELREWARQWAGHPDYGQAVR